jgi:hypothetical protein
MNLTPDQGILGITVYRKGPTVGLSHFTLEHSVTMQTALSLIKMSSS